VYNTNRLEGNVTIQPMGEDRLSFSKKMSLGDEGTSG
jgi:hypothetical protein